MKLQLNKKKIKTLSTDNNSIPAAMTPQVAGGGPGASAAETCNLQYCTNTSYGVACKPV